MNLTISKLIIHFKKIPPRNNNIFTIFFYRKCRIRSPNFPGIYPRNLTCHYTIQHRTPPSGIHAMITVRQPDGHKLHIKEQGPNFEQNNRALRYVSLFYYHFPLFFTLSLSHHPICTISFCN